MKAKPSFWWERLKGKQIAPVLTGFVFGIGLVISSPAAQALSPEEARHLLNRTGFTATAADIMALAPFSRAQAVDRLLQGVRTEPVTPLPKWLTRKPPVKPGKKASEAQKKHFRKLTRTQKEGLRAWWVKEMVETPSPLTEKLVLFWHNHFTSELKKVRSAHIMYRQNALFRRHALDNFGVLLQKIAIDPAMLIYLDGRDNKASAPNENFARELLELFTLGEGHYSEKDIKEAARALTGWTVNQKAHYRGDAHIALFKPKRHDEGLKTFLRQTGPHKTDDIVTILLNQNRTAFFVTEKAWKAFISDRPQKQAVETIAQILRQNRYALKPWLRALLLSDAFWAPQNRGVLIKSPVDLLVGTVRQFEIPLQEGKNGLSKPMMQALKRLGQSPLDPPNVKGWPGGTEWMTANTLLARQEVIAKFTRAAEMAEKKTRKAKMRQNAMMAGGMMDLSGWFDALPDGWRFPDKVTLLLMPIDPVAPPAAGLEPMPYVRALLQDPAYQLM